MLGAIMLMPKRMPAAVRMNTTAVDSMFAHSGLTRSPMISLSFTSMKRNTNAGGMARTAITFTTRDDVDQRQAGDQDDGGGGYGAESEDRIERFAFSHGEVEAVGLVGDFSEGVGGGSGDGDGGDDAGLDHAESEERCAEAADDGLESLGEFGGLEIVGGHLMGEERRGGEDGGDGCGGG